MNHIKTHHHCKKSRQAEDYFNVEHNIMVYEARTVFQKQKGSVKWSTLFLSLGLFLSNLPRSVLKEMVCQSIRCYSSLNTGHFYNLRRNSEATSDNT